MTTVTTMTSPGMTPMREIMTGRDIGASIVFRSLGDYEARHPWPAETIVSAGVGIVFTRKAETRERSSYSTPFMEVYPPGASFIRGEGETPTACEDAAWAKYQLALNCSDGSGTHDWEPRGYRNGAGFCSRCGTFGSEVFSGDQLGQFCRECGVGTTFHWDRAAAGAEEFLCEEHFAKSKSARKAPGDQSLAQLLEYLLDEDEIAADDNGGA